MVAKAAPKKARQQRTIKPVDSTKGAEVANKEELMKGSIAKYFGTLSKRGIEASEASTAIASSSDAGSMSGTTLHMGGEVHRMKDVEDATGDEAADESADGRGGEVLQGGPAGGRGGEVLQGGGKPSHGAGGDVLQGGPADGRGGDVLQGGGKPADARGGDGLPAAMGGGDVRPGGEQEEGAGASDDIDQELARIIGSVSPEAAVADADRKEQAEEGEETPDMETLRKWVEGGGDIRSPVGQRFSRSSSGGKSDDYKRLSTAQKKEFRQKWGRDEYNKVAAKKSKSMVWRKVDSTKGVYLPIPVIIREEGGDDEARTATYNYVKACWKMGGRWRKFNKMTKRMEWLYMKQEVHELFEQNWKLYEEWSHNEGGGGNADGRSGGSPSAATVGASPVASGTSDGADNDDKKKGGAKRSRNATDPVPVPTPKKSSRSPFDIAMGNASMTKKTYQATNSKATMVLENIATKQAWVPFKGYWQSELKQRIDDMSRVVLDGFGRDFCTMEVKDVKAKNDQQALLNECIAFSRALDPKIESCTKLVGKILKMHQEATKED